MPDDFEAHFFCNLFLYFFNLLIHKFHDFPAIQTYYMVMVRNSHFILEPGSSIAQVQAADEVIFYKDINGAVYSCAGYIGLTFP